MLTMQDGAAAILKNPKIAISCNGLTDFHEIWHGDAIQLTLMTRLTVEICNFKHPRWRRPLFWKFEKSPYLGRGFSDFDEIWHGDAVPVRPFL